MILFNNPILKREFSTSSRSFKTNLLLWGYLLILSFVILRLWPASGIHSVASASGRNIIALFFCINLTLVILLVPAFSASSITFEKENNTFSTLFMMLMNPWEVMFGKLLAAISILVMIVLFSIPISSICALTGGISINFMIKVYSVIIVTAVSYGILGLAISSVCNKSSTAIIINYVFILIFAGVSWLPSVLFKYFVGFQEIFQVVKSFSPYESLFSIVYPEIHRITTNVSMVNHGMTSEKSNMTGFLNIAMSPYFIFCMFSVFLSIISFFIFKKNILKSSDKKGKSVEKYTGVKKALKRKLTWPFYLIDPLKRKKNIRRWSNPVFIAEMRSKIFANPKFLLRIVSVLFILSLGILCIVATQIGTNFTTESVNLIAIIFQITVVALLAPSFSSGLITDEITSNTLIPLRMTPVSPLKFVSGKLKATFFYVLIFMISSLFVILVMAYLKPQNVFPTIEYVSSGDWWGQLMTKINAPVVEGNPDWFERFWDIYWSFFMWLVILLLTTVTFLAGGLFASSISRKTGIATAISYSIAACICVVSFAPLVLGKMSYGISIFILSFNPFAAAIQVISDSAFQEFSGLWKYNIITLSSLIIFFLTASIVRTWYLFNHRD